MNKLSMTAPKIFTKEFLIYLDTIPKKHVNTKIQKEIVNQLNTLLDKKKISDCLLVLSFYLTSVMKENEEDFDSLIHYIKNVDADIATKSYIQ